MCNLHYRLVEAKYISGPEVGMHKVSIILLSYILLKRVCLGGYPITAEKNRVAGYLGLEKQVSVVLVLESLYTFKIMVDL